MLQGLSQSDVRLSAHLDDTVIKLHFARFGVLRPYNFCVLGDNVQKLVDKIILFGGIATTTIDSNTNFIIISASLPSESKRWDRNVVRRERRKRQMEIAKAMGLDIKDTFTPVLDSEFVSHACLFHIMPCDPMIYCLASLGDDRRLELPNLTPEVVRDRIKLVLSSRNADDWRQVWCLVEFSVLIKCVLLVLVNETTPIKTNVFSQLLNSWRYILSLCAFNLPIAIRSTCLKCVSFFP